MINKTDNSNAGGYLLDLKVSERIFSDEVDKQNWLKMMGNTMQKNFHEVDSFCLLDDHFRLLVERTKPFPGIGPAAARTEEDETDRKGETPKQILSDCFKEIYLPYYQEKRQKDVSMVCENISVYGVNASEKVSTCAEIHLLPLKQGYSKKLSDFWWSSYLTYCGAYIWSFLRPEHIWNCVDIDRKEAVRRFLYYQKKMLRSEQEED